MIKNGKKGVGWRESDQAAGEVDACRSGVGAVNPLGLGETKESIAGHGEMQSF